MKEIEELLAATQADGERAGQMIDDIKAGDEVLDRHTGVELPAAVKARTLAAVEARLGWRWRMRWLRAVAAVLVVGLALLVVVSRQDIVVEQGEAEHYVVSAEERQLWETALYQDELSEVEAEVDAVGMADLMIFLDEADTHAGDSFGKETDHETSYS